MGLSSPADPFDELARYYDQLMETVDYDRWLLVAVAISELAPAEPFRHLDLACGTGFLAKQLRRQGWPTVGIDLSPAMIAAARGGDHAPPLAVADMRAVPFHRAFGYITCLFDSVNFLLEDGDIDRAFGSVHDALEVGGIFYFDIITKRMVTEHFENQLWTERNDGFQTTWNSTFDRKTGIADTEVRVNRHPASLIRERIYGIEVIEAALKRSGLTLLGAFDAENWNAPSKKTIRVEFIAARDPAKSTTKALDAAAKEIRGLLR